MTNYRTDPSFPASKVVDIPMDDCKVEQRYSLEEIMGGDPSGTTDTDSTTHVMANYGKDSGYTKIYRKSGPPKNSGGRNTVAYRKYSYY